MVRAVLVASLLALNAAPAAAEDKLFGVIPIPDETDVRAQVIEKQPGEDWPFTLERGILVCVPVWGERHVYFAEELTLAEVQERTPRIVTVSVDPFSALFGGRELMRKFDDVMERAEVLMPYIAMGTRLCDQEGGNMIGPGGI